MKLFTDEQLAELAVNEMRAGYPKFLVAYLKRVRKIAGIAELTPHHIRVINNALMGYQPSAEANALTNDDAMEIANMNNAGE